MTPRPNPVLIGVTALCLLALGAMVRRPPAERLLTPPVRAAEGAPHSPDTIRCVWTTPLPLVGYRAAGLSPDGKFVGVVFNHSPGKAQERLALWRWQDRPARPLWSRPDPAASLVAVGAGGEALLTGARLDATRPFVTLRRGADGASLSVQPITLDGAVWDMQASADGRAVVTTGRHGLYLFPTVARPSFVRFPTLAGIGGSVALSDNGTYLAVGTWDDSGVSCDTMGRVPVWQYAAADDGGRTVMNRWFETEITPDGRFILGVSCANAHKNDGAVTLWRSDGGGTPLWRYGLGLDASQPKALVSQDGASVTVSYLRLITRGSRSVPVRHLLRLDAHGRVVWDVGYVMLAPTLVALAPDGHRITISDGGPTLYNLDAQRRITASHRMAGGATIREATATPDGRYVLVYASDGSLSLFQIG